MDQVLAIDECPTRHRFPTSDFRCPAVPSKTSVTRYDVVVIGGGLGGMTAANISGPGGPLACCWPSNTHKLGGLATWFRRRGGHVFDVALHGFPVGMIKSCRRYWTSEIADSIVQLKDIRFDNPMFSLSTTFDRGDFTRLLVERFRVPAGNVEAFFDAARNMNFYDDQATTAGQLFERFFPGREDVVRLLMEPITYANGSTLEDPALSYGIVFSNFMSKGVYTFQRRHRSADRADGQELQQSGVDVRTRCPVEKIHVAGAPASEGVTVARPTRSAAQAVVSNANLLGTIFNLVGPEPWDADFLEQARAVRLNNSSTQVYMALKPETPHRPEPVRRPAVQLHRPGVSHRPAAEPQRHQPDLFVLLSADPAGPGPLRDRGQHERQLRRLGRPVTRKTTQPANAS